ncbi:hypothetical protein IAU60_006899 [Kwoniella sp. DSM 27419]
MDRSQLTPRLPSLRLDDPSYHEFSDSSDPPLTPHLHTWSTKPRHVPYNEAVDCVVTANVTRTMNIAIKKMLVMSLDTTQDEMEVQKQFSNFCDDIVSFDTPDDGPVQASIGTRVHEDTQYEHVVSLMNGGLNLDDLTSGGKDNQNIEFWTRQIPLGVKAEVKAAKKRVWPGGEDSPRTRMRTDQPFVLPRAPWAYHPVQATQSPIQASSSPVGTPLTSHSAPASTMQSPASLPTFSPSTVQRGTTIGSASPYDSIPSRAPHHQALFPLQPDVLPSVPVASPSPSTASQLKPVFFSPSSSTSGDTSKSDGSTGQLHVDHLIYLRRTPLGNNLQTSSIAGGIIEVKKTADKIRTAIAQAVLYLATAHHVQHTYLGGVIVGTRFGRQFMTERGTVVLECGDQATVEKYKAGSMNMLDVLRQTPQMLRELAPHELGRLRDQGPVTFSNIALQSLSIDRLFRHIKRCHDLLLELDSLAPILRVPCPSIADVETILNDFANNGIETALEDAELRWALCGIKNPQLFKSAYSQKFGRVLPGAQGGRKGSQPQDPSQAKHGGGPDDDDEGGHDQDQGAAGGKRGQGDRGGNSCQETGNAPASGDGAGRTSESFAGGGQGNTHTTRSGCNGDGASLALGDDDCDLESIQHFPKTTPVLAIESDVAPAPPFPSLHQTDDNPFLSQSQTPLDRQSSRSHHAEDEYVASIFARTPVGPHFLDFAKSIPVRLVSPDVMDRLIDLPATVPGNAQAPDTLDHKETLAATKYIHVMPAKNHRTSIDLSEIPDGPWLF